MSTSGAFMQVLVQMWGHEDVINAYHHSLLCVQVTYPKYSLYPVHCLVC